ncbi:MAG: hypothetical protein NTW10_12235 [Bacteroidetes bacterium]|nr:hypothetical protein [Bacteroidota bacterium]
MRIFLTRILFFLSPVILLSISEAFIIPPDAFTFRCWEAVSFTTAKFSSIGPFYPNQDISMTEEGDLGHNTRYAVKKRVRWRTDNLGFRNDAFISDPDILFLGDSFLVGTSLSQEETLANQVGSMPGASGKVYEMNVDFNKLPYLLKYGILKKPRLVIFVEAERNIPKLEKLAVQNNTRGIRSNLSITDLRYGLLSRISVNAPGSVIDRLTRFYSVKWLSARMTRKPDTLKKNSPGNTSDMLFIQGLNSDIRNKESLDKSLEAIRSYKEYCSSQGIGFLFVPMPNKESVYYDLVPYDHQPQFLFELDSLLKQSGISSINTLALYNGERMNGKMLYAFDDTHWTGAAVKLVAAAVSSQQSAVGSSH